MDFYAYLLSLYDVYQQLGNLPLLSPEPVAVHLVGGYGLDFINSNDPFDEAPQKT